MKKLLCLILILGVIGIAGCKQEKAMAGTLADLLAKLPVTNAGCYYPLDGSKHFEFTSSFRALEYKWINLNLGYASPDTAVVMLGVQLVKLEKLGIKLPVLKDLVIDAGWAVGWREPTEEQEFNQGPAITLGYKF